MTHFILPHLHLSKKCVSDLCAQYVTVSECNQLWYPEICGEYEKIHIDHQLGKPTYQNLNYSGIILRPAHHFWMIMNQNQSFAISMNHEACPYILQNQWHVFINNNVSTNLMDVSPKRPHFVSTKSKKTQFSHDFFFSIFSGKLMPIYMFWEKNKYDSIQ